MVRWRGCGCPRQRFLACECVADRVGLPSLPLLQFKLADQVWYLRKCFNQL
jgi:hypothetical protein